MKTVILGKIIACCFLIVITIMTGNYISINWNAMTNWYRIILTGSSFIILSGLIALVTANKEIAKSLLLTLPVGILMLCMIKAGSSREGLNDSSLLWFKYKETMSYVLKLLWHMGLDLLVFGTAFLFRHLPFLFVKLKE